jgi:chorismate lyase
MDNQLKTTFFQMLYQLSWDCQPLRPNPSSGLQSWLHEQNSMTVRLKKFCRQLTVDVVQEGFCAAEKLSEYERQALLAVDGSVFWTREVLLCGDGVPWLAGRTVVPESSLVGTETQLLNLGSAPLGQFLFSVPDLQREFLRVAKSDRLWGRSSLFKLRDKPLLLTELFLPESPAYQPIIEE